MPFLRKAIITREHNNNPKELKEVIHDITKYALNHFSTEETLMIEFNYPEYESHKEEHSVFARKMITYFNKMLDGYQITDEILE